MWTATNGGKYVGKYRPAPDCSKLTTSLVNVSLKFQRLISEIRQDFVEKMWEAFAVQQKISLS